MHLSYDRTVPRQLTHRHALGEVFIADAERLGPEEFALAAQIPRAHSLWGDRRLPFHDPMSTVEAARQGTFVVLHRFLEVPLGLPFSLRRFRFRVLDLESYRDDRRTPLQGVLTYRLAGRRAEGDQLGDLTFEARLRIGDRPALWLSGDVVFMPRDDYDALRAYQRARMPARPDPGPPPAVLAPAEVGRFDERNVVIGTVGPDGTGPGDEGRQRFELVPDLGHPAFFDHGYDHVPGPFIVEGFRQAALVTAVRAGAIPGPEVATTGVDVTFHAFAEFEGDLECLARPVPSPDGAGPAVATELRQFGKVLTEATVQLQQYP